MNFSDRGKWLIWATLIFIPLMVSPRPMEAGQPTAKQDGSTRQMAESWTIYMISAAGVVCMLVITSLCACAACKTQVHSFRRVETLHNRQIQAALLQAQRNYRQPMLRQVIKQLYDLGVRAETACRVMDSIDERIKYSIDQSTLKQIGGKSIVVPEFQKLESGDAEAWHKRISNSRVDSMKSITSTILRPLPPLPANCSPIMMQRPLPKPFNQSTLAQSNASSALNERHTPATNNYYDDREMYGYAEIQEEVEVANQAVVDCNPLPGFDGGSAGRPRSNGMVKSIEEMLVRKEKVANENPTHFCWEGSKTHQTVQSAATSAYIPVRPRRYSTGTDYTVQQQMEMRRSNQGEMCSPLPSKFLRTPSLAQPSETFPAKPGPNGQTALTMTYPGSPSGQLPPIPSMIESESAHGHSSLSSSRTGNQTAQRADETLGLADIVEDTKEPNNKTSSVKGEEMAQLEHETNRGQRTPKTKTERNLKTKNVAETDKKAADSEETKAQPKSAPQEVNQKHAPTPGRVKVKNRIRSKVKKVRTPTKQSKNPEIIAEEPICAPQETTGTPQLPSAST